MSFFLSFFLSFALALWTTSFQTGQRHVLSPLLAALAVRLWAVREHLCPPGRPLEVDPGRRGVCPSPLGVNRGPFRSRPC